jgi:hypothetical protein
MEEEARRVQGPSEEERLRAAAEAAARDKVLLARMEASDEAKRMNRMVLYSTCVTIRLLSQNPLTTKNNDNGGTRRFDNCVCPIEVGKPEASWPPLCFGS